MQSLKHNLTRLITLTHQHQMTPLLASLTVLMCLFYPASQLSITQVNLQASSLALAFGLSTAIISFGLLEASRKKRIKVSLLSGWLIICTAILSISAFYQHASTDQAYFQTTLITLAVFIFIALQQFRFSYQERQYLLWLPLGLAWFYFPSCLSLSAASLISHENSPVRTLDPHTTGIILLTSFALSAYLLARSKFHRQPWTRIHIPLILTPLLSIPSIMAWQQPWLITAAIAIFLMVQAFLFQYCSRGLHAVWNMMALIGFSMGWLMGNLPVGALFSPRFQADEWEIIKQTLALLQQTRFEGVGLGHLEQAQLLFGQVQGEILPVTTPYPSWILALITEGGITTWLPMGILVCLMFRRFMIAPSATRLMLFSILMPSLIGMIFTSYASTQPMLVLLFILLLYWLDNLSASYYRIQLNQTYWLRAIALVSLFFISLLTLSSLFLSQQSENVYRLNNNEIERFRYHPWWSDFYQQHLFKRTYLQSILQDDQTQKDAFLMQQMQQLATRPTAQGYQNLIEIALQTDNLYIAQQMSEEAKILFPMHSFTIQAPKYATRSAQ